MKVAVYATPARRVGAAAGRGPLRPNLVEGSSTLTKLMRYSALSPRCWGRAEKSANECYWVPYSRGRVRGEVLLHRFEAAARKAI